MAGAKDPEELEGILGLDFFHPRYRSGLKEKIDTLSVGGQKTAPMEQKIIRFDGSVVDVETIVFSCHYDEREAVTIIVEDLTGQKEVEKALARKEKNLEEKTRDLKDANAALKVLAAQRNEEKETVESAVLANIKELVLPYIERVRGGRLTESQAAYMDMIESSLNHIASPFLQKTGTAYSQLTPTEIQVADMIRNGKTSKEIAELLNVCTGTVEGHRISIRKKLGISNKKVNLQSYLASM
jgi:DNA-binding NarL/FixJ family response regulator